MKTIFTRTKKLVLTLTLLIIAQYITHAQTWTAITNNQGFDDQVICLYADDANNTLYAGGAFTKVDGTTVNGIAKWDGTQWTPMGDGFAGSTPYVYSITKYNNDIYAAGQFVASGTTTVNGIARWDGTQWQPVDGGLTLTTQFDYGASLHVYNNELYVGGRFSTVGSSSLAVNNLAKWDGTKWQTVADGANDAITSMHTHNNELYIGGYFVFTQQIGIDVQYRIAKMMGNNLVAVGSKGLGDATDHWSVQSMETYNGALYAGGNFNVLESGTTTANNIAEWDGTQWNTMGNPVGITSTSGLPLRALATYNNKLFAGGDFTSAGMASSAKNIAYWDGTQWHNIGQGTDGLVTDMVVFKGDLIIAGGFITAGGQSTPHIAKYSEPVSTATIGKQVTVTIAPNPFSEEATLTIGADQQLHNATLSIYDATGRLIKTYTNITHNTTIERGDIPVGNYIYTLSNNSTIVKQGKLTIQ